MGNLSNLYISQSFQSLIHLGSDTTASATLTALQDGLGNSIGISVNTAGDLKLNGALSASAITALNQSTASLNAFTASQINLNATYATTGSNNFVGDQNINGNASITGSLVVTGEITANKLNVIIESSSVIFSSGSNILGDAPSDTQTLNGTVYSNGNLYVTGEMSASSVSGIGNATIYSASVASRLNNIEFSTSSLNSFSASIGLYTASVNTFSASTLGRLTSIESFTASANLRLNSLETFSSSTNARLNSIEIVTASLAGTNAFTQSTNARLTSIENKTGSLASTGSNTFIGNQTLTGSLVITGSAYGNVNTLSIVSNTASMDMSAANYFELSLVAGATTRLKATNVGRGQTVNLLITQSSPTTGSLVFGSEFKFPYTNVYTASFGTSSIDIISFVTFGSTSSVYAAPINNLLTT
jgi:cytoskeletal protein CcmA (bactofilin family)